MPARPPSCPRCGYDQSGLLAAYTTQCPLGGRCTECGLEFDWTHLIHADRLDVSWLYEHTPRWRIDFRRAWKTWAHAMLPWHFWSRVPVEARVVPWRLGLWLLLIFGTLQFLAAAPRAYHAHLWTSDWAMRSGLPSMPAKFYVAAFLNSLTEPFLFVHFNVSPPQRIEYTPGWEGWPGPAKAALAPILLMGVMVLLLGASRAATKVSWRHVARATVYSTAIFAPWAALLVAEAVEQCYLAVVGGRLWDYGAVRPFIARVIPYAGALTLLWFFAWWYFAIVRGFALPRGRLIWALCTAACLILALIAVLSDTWFVRNWF